jgi:hypothetical protein
VAAVAIAALEVSGGGTSDMRYRQRWYQPLLPRLRMEWRSGESKKNRAMAVRNALKAPLVQQRAPNWGTR